MSIPKHYSPVMPYLVLKDAEGFIDFITKVFDAKEILRVNDDNGELRHANTTSTGER
ncbi:MAG TPA: hypothetical protein VFZ49_02910 [Pyrinomonadaceae bacterium]